MLAGAVTTFDPLPPAGSRAERRAVRAAKLVARREARMEARRARFEALGLTPPPMILASSSGRTDVSGSTRSAAPATTRSSDAPGQPTNPSAPTADAAGTNAQDPKSPPPTDNGFNGPEQILPIKGSDMTPEDQHTKMRRGGEAFMFANSTLSTNVDLPTEAHSLSVFAHADGGGGEWPILTILVNGEPVGNITINSTVDKKFYLPIQADPGNAEIKVQFSNDVFDPTTGHDLNVYLSKIKVHVGA
jgi:predicted xylan-binding protein with Ca-dependent carbohydrate-binding module